MERLIYHFEDAIAVPEKDQKAVLGGKGAGLAKMTSIGMPVPPGFTIVTFGCEYYYGPWQEKLPEDFKKDILEHIKGVESKTGKKFGNPGNPLLVSVRSGAAVSMPGMMDTILNLGLNDETAAGFAKLTNNERFAFDCYRRLMQMFGNVVLGINHDDFEEVLDHVKESSGAKTDQDLKADDLKKVIEGYKQVVLKATGKPFPQDPNEQLFAAIIAVFKSWNNPRAHAYRQLYDIRGLRGTAVNVQTMVFGNMGDDSGTGVCFTRNPSIGDRHYFGEYLTNAQGEDVVAGIRTPSPIAKLEQEMPICYKQLTEAFERLEKNYKDMQDVEFTIERGKLYLLQTRNGKRAAQAAVKIAVDLVSEGIVDKEEALMRVNPQELDQLLHKRLDPKSKALAKAIAKGLPASPGAAVGQAVFTAEDAIEWSEQKKKVILVRAETSPEDVMGMAKSQGILTATGGMTSHAAVVGRGMGKCCVVGCGAITVSAEGKFFEVGGKKYKEGDWITLDGSTGEVYGEKLETKDPEFTSDFTQFMEWADKTRRLEVRTNADTPFDAKVARNFGAHGIGLCRTEHMFFAPDRIKAMREMILADDLGGRKKALEKLLPFQREDFVGILEAMRGHHVTIRTLDPPLHEFLPHQDEEIKELAADMGISEEKLRNKIESLHEVNPMLGHRGCRLGIVYPEITIMQARAILEAACQLKQQNVEVYPEIMIPLVGDVNELANQKKLVLEAAEEVFKAMGCRVDFQVGTMIEVPRGALTADDVAKEAEFFSFGTNDLTQMTFGFSRDDVGKFIRDYIDKGILEKDPFQVLDQRGVGQLVRMAVEKGRKTRPGLHCGICGEHGGEPSSVEFCHTVGLDYVSCSPYRVPIARLAAAQAVIREKRSK
ncbi:MAG TPA: pyruvate, phosphate dikinase [Caldisericia bacterium]|nr:MAG: Pyruvate, phosphate dikinase [bacterium ADurb.Bin132]HNW31179.1 pyruvate, phosphate dikinase [Caldisericia bacterium]HNY61001.1 pyruvate, phosphate dikinase [Caldisericia bacterium]HOC78934.1 pyruvate, phosphate dikinase [Caldisericia bacterium]HOG69721.1 pyruvate, phosphate dikinase [Caldisericia bacterium]